MWNKPLELEQSDYDKIICPTLLITGTRDEFGSIEDAKAITALVKDARFVALEGVDHMVPIKKPALIQKIATPFLRDDDG